MGSYSTFGLFQSAEVNCTDKRIGGPGNGIRTVNFTDGEGVKSQNLTVSHIS